MNSQKISSIELGRVIAIFAIVAMHCQMFLNYWLVDEVPWVGYIFNQATRFAVPLFFLISGFLIQPKLEANPVDTFKNYAKPLLKVFVVWSVICLLLPFRFDVVMSAGYLAERTGYWNYLAQMPLNSILEGGLVHLWFIPALIMAVGIGALLVHFKLTKLFVPVGIILYGYGVLAGSYQGLTELSSPFFTRNGPFFSTLLVALGFYIRREKVLWSNYKALLLMLIGLFFHLKEAHWLHFQGQPFNANDFVFGTVFWGVGCFMLLLANPNLGNNKVIEYLSPKVLAIFVAHLPLIIIMKNISGMLGLGGLTADLVVLSGTIILTLGLIELAQKFGASRLLFR